MSAPARLLAIGGSDPSGGAGVQADIKTIAALGGYAMSAITAVTVQNTRGVQQVQVLPPDLVRGQICAVAEDIGVDALKTGMLGNAFAAAAVADALAGLAAPVIIDPVLVSSSGTALLDEDGLSVLRARLLPMAALVTPNVPEAEALAGITIASLEDRRTAAAALLDMGAGAVLITGGDAAGETLTDFLMWPRGEAVLHGTRINTRHTHGTGCTLASAVATYMAQGLNLLDAVRLGRAFVHDAIRHAPGLGGGHGPLAHRWKRKDAEDEA